MDEAKALEIIKDLADDLTDEIDHRYHDMLDYPAMRARYDRDMESVYRAREFLKLFDSEETK